jgi:hypothetical protein
MLGARVFGAIEASGLVLMGEQGFRAERARIIAVVTRNRRVAGACSEAGIAVYRRRRHLVRDYPPEDVSSLLGDRHRDQPSAWWLRWLAALKQGVRFAACGAPPCLPPPLPSLPPSQASWPQPRRSFY